MNTMYQISLIVKMRIYLEPLQKALITINSMENILMRMIFKPKLFFITFLLLIFSNALSGIFDNGKKLILFMGGTEVGKDEIDPIIADYINLYLKSNNHFKIDYINGRHWPFGINNKGAPDPLNLYYVPNSLYLSNSFAKNLILKKKEENNCNECEVIFIAYSHNILRQLNNNEWLSNPSMGYLVADSTNLRQIEQAISWAKFYGDKMKSSGVDYFILSTGVNRPIYNRVPENLRPAIRKFNTQYISENMFWVDLITPTTGPNLTNRMTGNHAWLSESSIIPQTYFQAMLSMDGLPEPEWIHDKLKTETLHRSKQNEFLRYLGPLKGHYSIGDTIQINFEMDCNEYSNPYISINLGFWRRDTLLSPVLPTFNLINLLTLGK